MIEISPKYLFYTWWKPCVVWLFSNIFEVNDDLKIIWVSMGWTTFHWSEVLIVIDHSGLDYYYINIVQLSNICFSTERVGLGDICYEAKKRFFNLYVTMTKIQVCFHLFTAAARRAAVVIMSRSLSLYHSLCVSRHFNWWPLIGRKYHRHWGRGRWAPRRQNISETIHVNDNICCSAGKQEK